MDRDRLVVPALPGSWLWQGYTQPEYRRWEWIESWTNIRYRCAIGGSLHTIDDGQSNSSFTTASISPTSDNLQVAFVVQQKGGTQPAAPSLSGGGITTWAQEIHLNVRTGGSSKSCITMFRALESSPGSGTVTITLTASADACNWSFVEFSGVDTGGTNGSAAVVQTATQVGSADGTGTVTLSAFADTDNRPGCGMNRNMGADRTWNVESGYTWLAGPLYDGSEQKHGHAWNSTTADTTPSNEFVGPGDYYGMIGFEIGAAAAAPAFFPPWPPRRLVDMRS